MNQQVSHRTRAARTAVQEGPRWARACLYAGTALTLSSAAAWIVLGTWR